MRANATFSSHRFAASSKASSASRAQRFSISPQRSLAKARSQRRWRFTPGKVALIYASGILLGVQATLVLTGTSLLAAGLGGLSMLGLGTSLFLTCR